MTNQEITDLIKKRFPDTVVDSKDGNLADSFIRIVPTVWKEIAFFLVNDPALQLDYLMCISGIDYGKGTLGTVYNIYSMQHKHKVNIKIDVPADAPDIPSVSEIWPTANWHEREAYDMIGIKFIGHPDLRRILMPDDWEGHPLRKDYQVPEFYRGMKVQY